MLCSVHCEPKKLLVLRIFGVACGARESLFLYYLGYGIGKGTVFCFLFGTGWTVFTLLLVSLTTETFYYALEWLGVRWGRCCTCYNSDLVVEDGCFTFVADSCSC